jgi:hypothetical protein
MKKAFGFAVMTVALLFAVGAFAGDRTINLRETTSINGQKLAAGEYKMEYQVNGSTAEVHFLKGKKEVASTSAQVVEAEKAPGQDAIITQDSGDGTAKLLEIQFARQKSSIRFGSEPSAGN